jgi:hypothetical protein
LAFKYVETKIIMAEVIKLFFPRDLQFGVESQELNSSLIFAIKAWSIPDLVEAGNTKGGSITVPLTSCLTCID